MKTKEWLAAIAVLGAAVGLWLLNEEMKPSAKPLFMLTGLGEDHSWDDAKPCYECHSTGYDSWAFFGLISSVCPECNGKGWIKNRANSHDSSQPSRQSRDEYDGQSEGQYEGGGQSAPSGNSGGVAVPPPPVSPGYSGYDGGYEESSPSVSTKRTCPSCNGSGKGMDQIVYAPNYTGEPNDEYCSECGRISSAHSHIRSRCATCGGSGSI